MMLFAFDVQARPAPATLNFRPLGLRTPKLISKSKSNPKPEA